MKKNLSALILIMISVFTLTCCDLLEVDQNNVKLIPLEIGNYWIYGPGFIDDFSNDFDGFKMEVSGNTTVIYEDIEKEVFNISLFELKNNEWVYLQDIWLKYEDNGLFLYYFNPNIPNDIIRVRLHKNPMKVGDSWQSVMNEELTCTGDKVNISTLAGEFKCYEITSSDGTGYFCSQVGFVEGWFYIAYWHAINTSLIEYGNYEETRW